MLDFRWIEAFEGEVDFSVSLPFHHELRADA